MSTPHTGFTVSTITRYWKTIVALAGLVATFVQAVIADPTVSQAIADDTITTDEWVRIACML